MADDSGMTAIGAISGTSMDGIDVSMVMTDGDKRLVTGPGRTYPYADDLRRQLLTVAADAESAEKAPLTDLDEAVSDAHADAILAFMRDYSLDKQGIKLVGVHGQTICHRPERRFTRQLGIGARVAERLGIDVVNQFRHADVAAGGEGAPFAPLYHRALAASLKQPLMVLNLGGVANVTYLDGDRVIAFDAGPASALLDDFVLRRTGKAYDDNGRLAASGAPNKAMVARWLQHPYFTRPAPKSLDRNDFNALTKDVERLSNSDGAATLAAFTVESVAGSLALVPKQPVRWLVCGGGRLNQTFMQSLAARLKVPVEPVEAVGWNGDFIEAQCFAYLAVRSRRGLPLSLPTTTGVPQPMTGGTFWPAP